MSDGQARSQDGSHDLCAPATTLDEASLALDGQRPLVPHTLEYEHYYVERPKVESSLLRESRRARRVVRPFHWFFTGHTGSGKSTELNRIISEDELESHYVTVYIDLETEANVHNLEYTDLILTMGKACAAKAEELKAPVAKPLREAIATWGAEVLHERETSTKTEGEAGLKIPFLSLGEVVRSGGTRREIVRKRIATDLLGFIRLIDGLAAAVEEKTDRGLLCVLDGLDHVSADAVYKLLCDHYETLTLPKISKIVVVPLSLLNTPFLATIERQFSTVPNIKVFSGPGEGALDEGGFAFFRTLIERHASLDLFTDAALRSLFHLSAGIVREMIRNAGDACGYASEDRALRVEERHAQRVWHDVMRYYRSQLRRQDYDVLRAVESSPYLMGVDGVPPLLHSKAVVFYPNGEGWYGVHPAVRRILREASDG